MFTKKRISLGVRLLLTLVLFNGAYGSLPIEKNGIAYALGETPGALDATFDGDGLVTTDISIYGDQGWAVSIQPDGKIVVGGYSHSGGSTNFDFVLCRYNSNGSLDTTFDTDGKVTADFGNHQDYARAIALQTDGKIVIAGYSEFHNGTNTESEFALARYNSDGSLDTSFDSDGKVTTNLGDTYEFLGAIAIQTDGKIIVVGSKNIGINNDDIVVVRYNSDGSLDTTFDTDGIVNTAIGSGYETAMSVALQPDGKLLVGGVTYNGSNMDFALLRYNSNGVLDTSFDTDGIVTKDFVIGSGNHRGGHIAIQPDGKILIAGDNGEGYFELGRFNNDGSPDTTFGTDGFVTTLFSYSSYDQVQDIALQKNGKIILAGHTGSDFALARYESDGSLDSSFDGDGKLITDLGSNQDDLANTVALQADGKIILAGYTHISGSNYDIAVARYFGDLVSQTHYVKWDATGANDGTSWTDAYTYHLNK